MLRNAYALTPNARSGAVQAADPPTEHHSPPAEPRQRCMLPLGSRPSGLSWQRA